MPGAHRFFRLPVDCLHRGDLPARTPTVNGVLFEGQRFDALTTDQLDLALQRPGQQEIIHRRLLAASLAYYNTMILMGPPEEPYHGKFICNNHVLEWDEMVQRNTRVLIKAARDHGKSFCFSVGYTLWRADASHPGSLIYLFSANQTLAEERLAEVRFQLDRNPKLAHLTNDRTKDTAREIMLTTGSVIRARGWGVRVRGGHPRYIVCDDILDDQAIYSETLRRRATEYFFSVPSNMVVPGGQIVVIGTPFHHADVYTVIERTGKYAVKVYPSKSQDGTALFSERYSIETLKEKEEEIGAARFAREYMCIPLTDEASYFPTHLFEGPGVRMPYVLGLPWKYWHDLGCEQYTGVDIAMSSAVGADYFVIFTLAVNPDGERFIANIRRGKGWSLQRQLDELKAENELMRPCVFHIESNQAQRLITDEARVKLGLPVRYFFTSGVQPKKDWTRGMTTLSANKHALDRGVPSLRLSLEAKKWRIPRGDARSIELTDLWIGEMNMISYQDAKIVSVGEHDDTVFACWFAEVAAQLGGAQSFVFVDAETEPRKDLMGSEIPTRFKQPAVIAEKNEDFPEFDPFGLLSDDDDGKVFS